MKPDGRFSQSSGAVTASGVVLLGVVGPPGAGKSTLTRDLAETRHMTRGPGTQQVRVFRLREFVTEQRRDPHAGIRTGGAADSLADTVNRERDISRDGDAPGGDPLGWLPEHTVEVLIEAAVSRGRIGSPGLTMLEGFPGSRRQLRLLHRIATDLGARPALLELHASDRVVRARVAERRVCGTCEPDPRGDPHRPASPSPIAPGRCAVCGGVLTARSSDLDPLLTARLRRYRHRITGIRAAAAELGVTHQSVDAGGPPTGTFLQAIAALEDMQTSPETSTATSSARQAAPGG